MDQIETRAHSSLKPHPKNTGLFGPPDADPTLLKNILTSIQTHGQQEPVVILDDGTILSGHIRHHVLGLIAQQNNQSLDETQVKVRVHPPFESEEEEESWLIEANVQRRQLSKEQIANLFDHLKKIESKKKMGRPKKGESRPESGPTGTGRRAAQKLGIGAARAESLVTVYKTEGVPQEIKEQVTKGTLNEKMVSKAIRSVAEDGVVKDPEKLTQVIDDLKWKTLEARAEMKSAPAKLEAELTVIPAAKPVEPEPVKLALHERVAEVGRSLGLLLEEVPEDSYAFHGELRSIRDRISGYLDALNQPPVPQPTPLLCGACGEPQFNTPSGLICKNGHGGAESLDAPPASLDLPLLEDKPEPKKTIVDDLDLDAILSSAEDYSDVLKGV